MPRACNSSSNRWVKPLYPNTCVRNTALVRGVILARICSTSMHRVRGLMSVNTGVNPFCSTEAMSETQVSVGTMTSPKPAISRNAAMVTKLAEAPELTNTLYFTPSHRDHSSSKARTFFDCVRIGFS